MPRPPQRNPHHCFRRQLISQEMRRGQRVLDEVSGRPAYMRNCVYTADGWIDMRVHFPDIDPRILGWRRGGTR